MELLLNLGWLTLSLLLCSGCVWAHRRGAIRLSLPVALGCTLLLAVLLFPAISMTDDLQRTTLELEGRVRDLAVLDGTSLFGPVDLLPLLLALLFASALARTRLLWLAIVSERRARSLSLQAALLFPRPPTTGTIATA